VRSLRATGATRFKIIAREPVTRCACQIGVFLRCLCAIAAKPDTACDDAVTTGRFG
jgi:hypothetical protein